VLFLQGTLLLRTRLQTHQPQGSLPLQTLLLLLQVLLLLPLPHSAAAAAVV
jgi:hypothetical protein